MNDHNLICIPNRVCHSSFYCVDRAHFTLATMSKFLSRPTIPYKLNCTTKSPSRTLSLLVTTSQNVSARVCKLMLSRTASPGHTPACHVTAAIMSRHLAGAAVDFQCWISTHCFNPGRWFMISNACIVAPRT